MRKNNFLKRTLLAATFALAVAVLVPTVNPVEANAATKKITGNANYKKAPKVTVNKTYKVTSKSKNGTYVKFTAPKAGKYVVTISDLHSYGVKASAYDWALANFYIKKVTKSSYGTSTWLSTVTVKTQGGNSGVLYMATPTAYKQSYKGQKVTVKNYYPQKRTATFSMKKGETVYVNMNFFTGNTKNRCTYNLKINKK